MKKWRTISTALCSAFLMVTTAIADECKPVSVELLDNGLWEFTGASPSDNITGFAAPIGAGKVVCSFTRPVRVWYNCCDRAYFPDTSNEIGLHVLDISSTLPTRHFSVSVPGAGVAGATASATGASFTLGVWWADKKTHSTAVEACTQVAPNRVSLETQPPTCTAEGIRYGGGPLPYSGFSGIEPKGEESFYQGVGEAKFDVKTDVIEFDPNAFTDALYERHRRQQKK